MLKYIIIKIGRKMNYPRLKLRKFHLLVLISSILSLYMFYFISKVTVNKILDYRSMRLRKARDKNHIPVVVGHYIGQGTMFGNSSSDFLNSNNYDPVKGVGENGNPVVIPPRDILKMQQYFQINRFNLLASDRISINRSLPDERKKQCTLKVYPPDMPNTSIIIIFHNEAWSVLLRTIWSIINRSPKELLKEIILVDDASTRKFLGEELDKYAESLPVPTKILRLKTRDGLVAARLLGASIATGDTLTFLDSHCECTTGWLEPLLSRVKQDRRKVICPVIDIISDDNFGYIKSFEFHWGAFNWELHFRWFSLDEEELAKRRLDVTEPFKTPAMAGGLFTIDRNYFFEIGSYDKDLKIWGGDNLEMSFRVWQCGGEIEISPCSHVGHLFRKSSPYTFPGGVSDILNKNLARVAGVWMDDWQKFFFKFNKNANTLRSALDLSERISFRENHNCKSFAWYLKTIWPQNFFPADNKFFGQIRLINEKSLKSYRELIRKFKYTISWSRLIKFLQDNYNKFENIETMCLQKTKVDSSVQISMSNCSNDSHDLDKMFLISEDGQLMTDDNLCLEIVKTKVQMDNSDGEDENPVFTKSAKLVTCRKNTNQKWIYVSQTFQIKMFNTTDCLEAATQNDVNSPSVLIANCDIRNTHQKWMLFPVLWK